MLWRRPNDVSHRHSLGRPERRRVFKVKSLADRNAVLQAALGPQRIQPARDFQRRALADGAFKALTIVADRLDDPHRPVVGEAERFAELALDAEQTPDFRIGGLHLIVESGLA